MDTPRKEIPIHKIDAQIAIADAFDSGRLGRQANSQEIADAIGVGVKRIPGLIKSSDFKLIKIRRPNQRKISPRYHPPQRFPPLDGRASPTAHAVVELYQSGRWSGDVMLTSWPT